MGKPQSSIPLTTLEPTRQDLQQVIRGGARSGLDDVALALDAWRLRLADQFDELLCLARVKGVKRLDYQVETVHRVLRAFRGRALLADEVGLGKTIEAGMLISEYVLRGMARTVLVVCPAALVGQWRAELAEKFAIDAQSTDEARFRTNPEAAWEAEGSRGWWSPRCSSRARPGTPRWSGRSAGTSSWSTRHTT